MLIDAIFQSVQFKHLSISEPERLPRRMLPCTPAHVKMQVVCGQCGGHVGGTMMTEHCDSIATGGKLSSSLPLPTSKFRAARKAGTRRAHTLHFPSDSPWAFVRRDASCISCRFHSGTVRSCLRFSWFLYRALWSPEPSGYPHRRRSSTRSSKHFRQEHLKSLSSGIAEWPHLLQTNLPSGRAIICLNSSFETQ
jgi:hypothetical protein